MTDLLGEMLEERDHLLDRAGVLGPQVEILGGDAYRARVEVALADHLAAEGQEGQGPEAEPLGAEEGGDDDVSAGTEAAVGLEGHELPHALGDESLMGLEIGRASC